MKAVRRTVPRPAKLMRERDTNKRKAVGLLFSRKGGLAYAHYPDVSSVRDHRDSETYEEKQQPPLWQVTVVK